MKKLDQQGIKIIVDATNDLLKKVLPYHPFLIKQNHRELEELFNVKIENQEDLIFYARKLQEQGAINVLVSLGKDGAILVSEDNHVYYCAGAKGKLLNSVGSGDSMVAGFIAGYLKEKKYDEALKLGSACGGATAFSEDLADASMIQEAVSYTHLDVYKRQTGGSPLGAIMYIIVWNLFAYFGMKFLYFKGYELGGKAVDFLVGPQGEALRESVTMLSLIHIFYFLPNIFQCIIMHEIS